MATASTGFQSLEFKRGVPAGRLRRGSPTPFSKRKLEGADCNLKQIHPRLSAERSEGCSAQTGVNYNSFSFVLTERRYPKRPATAAQTTAITTTMVNLLPSRSASFQLRCREICETWLDFASASKGRPLSALWFLWRRWTCGWRTGRAGLCRWGGGWRRRRLARHFWRCCWLSRLFDLGRRRCLPCALCVFMRTKNSTTANDFPGVGDFNSTFKTVNCHFLLLLLDFGYQHHLSTRISVLTSSPPSLIPEISVFASRLSSSILPTASVGAVFSSCPSLGVCRR